MSFPQGDELTEVIRGFKEKWGFVQCSGSIDGSHIPVIAPVMNHTDYYNRKSLLVQAVVDHNYLFCSAYSGCPGSIHDAWVLVNSSLYSKANSGEILHEIIIYQCSFYSTIRLISTSLHHPTPPYFQAFKCLNKCAC